MSEINFKLNGNEIRVSNLDPHTSMLSFLRSRGLTGSKEGCAEGECGACALLLLKSDGDQSKIESVNGCLLQVAAVADCELWSIEGLGKPSELHPVQKSMLQGGSQCGYCTPGFVISMAAEYYRKDRILFDHEALSGNLCRCTGYRPILSAAEALTKPASLDPIAQRLTEPAPLLQTSTLKHPSSGTQFIRPVSLVEFWQYLKENPDAKIVSGATDWGVEVNLRHSRAQTQIAIDQIPELRHFHNSETLTEIGAALTLSEIELRLGESVPLIRKLIPLFASRLIRNRATLGGNIATASPIGDSPPVLLALGASLVLVSKNGERIVPLEGFFTGYRKTLLQKYELIKAILVPIPLAKKTAFYKISKRPTDDISTVAFAVVANFDKNSKLQNIRIGLGGVAATPVRANRTEDFLTGKEINPETLQQAKKIIEGEFQPINDHRGSARYRTAMLGNLLEKFFTEQQQ